MKYLNKKINVFLPILSFLFFFSFSSIFSQDYTELTKLTANDAHVNAKYGQSVDIEGEYLVVGAPDDTNDTSERGAVYLYEQSSGDATSWDLIQKFEPFGLNDYNANFGYSVDLNEGYLIVGANTQSKENTVYGGALPWSGKFYIYHKNNGGTDNWGLVTSSADEGYYGDEGYQIGKSVAITEDYAVIGTKAAFPNSTRIGFFYVYQHTFDDSQYFDKVEAPFKLDSSYFGSSVDISGETIIAGEPNIGFDSDSSNYIESAGAAHIYYIDSENDTVNYIKSLYAPERTEADTFGVSVTVKGDIAVVGASKEDSDVNGQNELNNAGSVYIYERNEGGEDNWGLIQKVVASNRKEGARFGNPVNLENDRLIIGARMENVDLLQTTIYNVGAVYSFTQNSMGEWTQSNSISGSETFAGDQFGTSIATSEDLTVVGTLNGDKTNLNNTGSVYVYENPAITSVDEPEEKPNEYKLSQNYPNPFNPTTTIEFSIVEPSEVELTVYNILGKEVSNLVDKNLSAGSHEVQFDASELPSGVYFYTLRTDDFMNTKKMILIK